jgi:thioredoxin 1
MKKIYSVAWCLFSCLSFCSCQPETSQTKQVANAPTSNVIYLNQLVTRADEATAKFNGIISTGNVVVDFYASWCGPCKYVSAAIDQIANNFPNVTFLKVDVDQYGDVARGIKSIPVLRLYKEGRQVYSKPGAKSARDLTALLKQYF